MPYEPPAVAPEEAEACRKASAEVAGILAEESLRAGRPFFSYVRSYGCQQNVSDGERLEGMLETMGYRIAGSPEEADLILFNTCAVREHAENRVFGNVGALIHQKRRNPGLIVGVCGCMPQQPQVAERFRKRYPFVDLIFGTQVLHRLPLLLLEWLRSSRRVVDISEQNTIAEDLPVHRDGKFKAWLPVMYGCDNFCSYCVVPLVRGRERSRSPENILREAEQLISDGYKEITLLGQNVNSYGKGSDWDFARLLSELDRIPGDYRLRFMTSHPKDCTRRLLDVMAGGEHICRQLHLPVQSGSNRVLQEMNRRYDTERYLSLIDYARRVMPDIAFSSDIIVGFPGETRADFEGTLELIRRVRYNALYTFIFSPREGTRAASMPDPVSAEEKGVWFRELLDVQGEIGEDIHRSYVGRRFRVLWEGPGRNEGTVSGRTEGGTIVEAPGDPAVLSGSFSFVRISRAMNWAVAGEICG